MTDLPAPELSAAEVDAIVRRQEYRAVSELVRADVRRLAAAYTAVVGERDKFCALWNETGLMVQRARAERDQAQAERDAVLLELPAIADKLRAARVERDQAQAEAARLRAALRPFTEREFESEYGKCLLCSSSREHRADCDWLLARQALGGGEEG